MTILLAYQSPIDCKVWLASDSRATCGTHISTDYTKKWIVAYPWALGISGDARTEQAIFGCKSPRVFFSGVNGADDFILKLHAALKRAGWTPRSDTESNAPFWDIDLILCRDGEGGGVWTISHALYRESVRVADLAAAGSGMFYALGAWHVIQAVKNKFTIPDVLALCVKAACRYDCACGGDIQVFALDKGSR